MEHERRLLCEALSKVDPDAAKQLIDNVRPFAEALGKNSPAWECKLCNGADVLPFPIRPVHILIVEDEPELVESMEAILKFVPHVFVKRADTGDNALHLATSFHFDAALVDLNLPDMSGFTVIEDLRKYCHETALYVVSAYDTLENLERAVALEVKGFIRKPYDPADLIELVELIKAT